MKPILLIVAIALTSILVGCGHHHCDAPMCSDPRWDCCEGNVCIMHVQDNVDVTSEYTVGMLCIGTNTQAKYTYQQHLSDVTISGSSPPQEQTNVTNCRLEPPGSYTITCLPKEGYLEPEPDREVAVRLGERAIIYCYYNNL